MLEIIDGYCHCGVSKYRPEQDVRDVMARFNVTKAVLVQHLGEYDNSYIQQVVRGAPECFAGVLLVNMDDPHVAKQLDDWVADRMFRGIRLLASSLRTHPVVWKRAARLGLVLVVYDEPCLARYAEDLALFAKVHPETHLVISHLGMPDVREAPGYSGQGKILSLAEQPNVFVQISGMHMFSQVPYPDLVPLVEQLVATFGPERLVYGSNYPVMKNEAVYQAERDLLCAGDLGIPRAAVEQVMCGTARRLWFD